MKRSYELVWSSSTDARSLLRREADGTFLVIIAIATVSELTELHDVINDALGLVQLEAPERIEEQSP